jgi:N-methylhydantoinase B
LCLTDSATFGACFGAVAACLQKPIPVNSGSFSLLHVTTPLGSLLNAKYPSPTFRGMSEGTSQVAGTVLQALGEIIPQKKFSASAQAPAQISLEFTDGPRFFDSLPGGIGASPSSEGADAIHFWQRNSLRNSVQEIETLFPILIHQVSIRKGSGGLGQWRGGNGLIKEYEILKEARLRWILQQRKSPPKGLKGAQSGEPAEISIQRLDGRKEILDQTEGEVFIKSGEKITVCSAGGGGYGKASS